LTTASPECYGNKENKCRAALTRPKRTACKAVCSSVCCLAGPAARCAIKSSHQCARRRRL